MSNTDERMDIVFRKASRMQRKRSVLATPALGACAILLGVGLVGAIGFFAGPGGEVTVAGLYGSSMMLNGDVGSYVIVAILAAAFAAVITLIFASKARPQAWYDSTESFADDEIRSS